MQSFKSLLQGLEARITAGVFPTVPETLYDPAHYILQLGGKRIRPVLCLMGNDLFDDISEDTYKAALAIELFHNFTLVHDDIMDEAPLRRGQPSVHQKFGASSALLAGDVLLVKAYEELNQIRNERKDGILDVFNRTAREVCEGQQLDMDLADLPLDKVKMAHYLQMITLKTSVLLAGSLQMGGLLGGGSDGNLKSMYAFGKNIGIAFQIQDDYLDAFGNPEKFGKLAGGDILSNKKTFLLIKAYELANATQKAGILALLDCNQPERKISEMLQIYKDCHIDQWAREQKEEYIFQARKELEQINVLSARKQRLEELVEMLLNRES